MRENVSVDQSLQAVCEGGNLLRGQQLAKLTV
jgi:hypothetical protein